MTTTLTAPTRTPTPLLEIAFSPAPKVDRDAGVIRLVKILGRESRNGRTYSDEALTQAAKLYEGIAVNIDHPETKSDNQRRFVDGFGYLRNVQRQDDGIYGDLVFLKSHVFAEQICEAAERMPQQFGLSHHATGYVATDQGKHVVEGFERIYSVDIVRNPATSRGLFERLEDAGITQSAETDAVIRDLREQINRLEAERDARDLLESSGVAVDANKIKALAALATLEERRSLVATWPRDVRHRPRSASPLSETLTSLPLPTDARSFARAIL